MSGTSIVVTGLFQGGMELRRLRSLTIQTITCRKQEERTKRDHEERTTAVLSVFIHPRKNTS
jgi:hypothetical protein